MTSRVLLTPQLQLWSRRVQSAKLLESNCSGGRWCPGVSPHLAPRTTLHCKIAGQPSDTPGNNWIRLGSTLTSYKGFVSWSGPGSSWSENYYDHIELRLSSQLSSFHIRPWSRTIWTEHINNYGSQQRASHQHWINNQPEHWHCRKQEPYITIMLTFIVWCKNRNHWLVLASSGNCNDGLFSARVKILFSCQMLFFALVFFFVCQHRLPCPVRSCVTIWEFLCHLLSWITDNDIFSLSNL